MPRPLRIHMPGAFYHVTLRGNHRQDVFFCAADRERLNEIVSEVLERFNARLHAYCWMTNHIHLLIQVSDAPLGRLMLRIASRYARGVQRRLQTTGHLFERRYHCVLVDADEYLLELLRYVHLNSVRARMVDNVDDHPWSSHHAYVGARREPWVTTTFALSLFHVEPYQAIAAYRRFVHEHVGRESTSPLENVNENDARVLGSDRFLARALGESFRPRSHLTLEQLLSEACARFAVSLEDLQSPTRQRRITRVRAWIAQRAVAQRIASLSALARALNRDESTLRFALRQYADPLK